MFVTSDLRSVRKAWLSRGNLVFWQLSTAQYRFSVLLKILQEELQEWQENQLPLAVYWLDTHRATKLSAGRSPSCLILLTRDSTNIAPAVRKLCMLDGFNFFFWSDSDSWKQLPESQSHIHWEESMHLDNKTLKSYEMQKKISFIRKNSAMCLFPSLKGHYFLPNAMQKRLLILLMKTKSVSTERN